MTRDRLKALQSVSGQIEERRPEPGYNPAFSVDEEYDTMEHFFRQVEQARAYIQEVKEHVKQMKRLHSTVLSSPRPDQETKKELEQRASQVKATVNKVSGILKALQKDDDFNTSTSASARIRRTQHSTCLHLLVEAITEFNNEQEDYKTKCEERIKRVISIARVEVSEEKMENLLETGNFGTIFNGDIITETLEAKQALEDVTARHAEILKLEKSIRDLRDLFVEMSILVETQGDMIDNIERQVQQTKDHVEKAANVAKKAVKYQSKFRHKRILLYSALALVILGLILAVVISFAVPSSQPTYSTVPTQQTSPLPSNRSLLNESAIAAATTPTPVAADGVVVVQYNASLSSTTPTPSLSSTSTTSTTASTPSIDIQLLPTASSTVNVPPVSSTVPTVSSTVPTVSSTVPTVSSTVPAVSSTVLPENSTITN